MLPLLLLLLGPVAVAEPPHAKSGGGGGSSKVPRTEFSHPCSRAESRSVRRQLEKEVLKPSTRAGIRSWPRLCSFDPALDLYGRHEAQKQHRRSGPSVWTCGLCGKQFRSEHYLDLHLERRHMNETPRNGVCLADYCEMFEVCARGGRRRPLERYQPPECDNGTMLKHRARCEQAMRVCFPLDEEVPRRMHAKLSRQWCRVLDCRIRAEQWKDHHVELVPVIVPIIFIVLVCLVVFCVVVFCVDYSEDIFSFLVDTYPSFVPCVRRMRRARENARLAVGMDRTRQI